MGTKRYSQYEDTLKAVMEKKKTFFYASTTMYSKSTRSGKRRTRAALVIEQRVYS